MIPCYPFPLVNWFCISLSTLPTIPILFCYFASQLLCFFSAFILQMQINILEQMKKFLITWSVNRRDIVGYQQGKLWFNFFNDSIFLFLESFFWRKLIIILFFLFFFHYRVLYHSAWILLINYFLNNCKLIEGFLRKGWWYTSSIIDNNNMIRM